MSDHAAIKDAVIDQAIRDNHMWFASQVDRAERLTAERRFEEAVRCLQDAAYFAWENGTGLFASPALERIAFTIAALNGAQAVTPKTPEGAIRRVLHVLTQSYFAGGHSRLAWRWMRRDTHRMHDCILTQQAGVGIPPQLIDAAEASGGQLIDLDDGPDSLLERAERLRCCSAGYDLIVLHTHPHDILPLLAYAPGTFDGRVAILNHASHVFWLGTGVANACICLLEEGIRLATARRHFTLERCLLLPLPLDAPEHPPERSVARTALGLPENATVLLSSGSPYKFNPVDGVDFRDFVGASLQRHTGTHLVLAGPRTNEYWDALSRIAPGRVHTLGYIPEDALETCYAAADIYLDAAPFGSGTALLEAASRGLPVISFATPRWREAGLCFDQDGLDASLFSFDCAAAYRDRLEALLGDPALRGELGNRLRTDVRATHFDAGWNDALEQMYARTTGLSAPAALPVRDEPRIDPIDRFLECISRAARVTPPAPDAPADKDGKPPPATAPADEARRYREAETLIEQDRPYAALSILDALAREGSLRWEVYNDLATLHFQNGVAEPAFRHMRRAVELETQGIDALLNLARMYMVSGLPGHALGALGEALGRRPANLAALAVLRDAAIVLAHQESDADWFAPDARHIEAENARLLRELGEQEARE